ncbi:hypothetical protein C7G64_18965, partial [Acinetobacter baumannii]
QVGGAEGGEVVGVEADGAVDGLKRLSREAGNVGDGHVGGPDQVRHADAQILAVGVDVEQGREVVQLSGEVGETVVVVDIHRVQAVDVDTLEGAQEGVGNGDSLGAGQTGSTEGQGVQVAQGSPVDGVNGRELGEGQGGDQGKVLQGEGTTNGLEGVRGQRDQTTIVRDSEVTTNAAGTRDIDCLASTSGDDNVAVNAVARLESGDVGGRLNSDGVITAVEGPGTSGQAKSRNGGNELLGVHCQRLNGKYTKILKFF